MTSKYGLDKYGDGLYSAAPYEYLEGSMSIVTGLSGNFLRVKTMAGSFPIAVTFSSATMSPIRGMRGVLDIFTTVPNSDLRRILGFRGGFDINTTWVGEIFVPHEVTLDGVMDIVTSFIGRAEMIADTKGTMEITVEMTGDPYIGGFWHDETSPDGPWNDTPPPSSIWTNTTPPSGGWS